MAPIRPKEIGTFLGDNAMRFLGLKQGRKNRRRLLKFYQAQGIVPPAWLVGSDPAAKGLPRTSLLAQPCGE